MDRILTLAGRSNGWRSSAHVAAKVVSHDHEPHKTGRCWPPRCTTGWAARPQLHDHATRLGSAGGEGKRELVPGNFP
jgi:hypothetical protein